MIILYQAMLGPAGEMNAIPGEAGVDYPVFNTGIIMMVMMMMMITISLYDYHHIQHLVFNTSQTSAWHFIFSVPDTGFDCADQTFPGFYTDPEAECQVLHFIVNMTTNIIIIMFR